MRCIPRQDVPVAIADGGVEVRVLDQDGMMVGFVTLPAGADLRPATVGLPHDLCPCPHWGYMLKGCVRMHTADGHQDFAAGQAFYWGPGHAPGGARGQRVRRLLADPRVPARPAPPDRGAGAGAGLTAVDDRA